MQRPSTSTPGIFRVILLIESSRASGRSMLRGIASYARLNGPWSFYWEPRGLEAAGEDLQSIDADGVILRDVEKAGQIAKWGIPAVVVGHYKRETPGLVNVITDDESIGELAAEHLLDCSLKNFAYCGIEGMPWSGARAGSFQRRLAKAGFSVHHYKRPPFIAEASWQTERRFMAEWLNSLPHPVGVMCCNDEQGEMVIEACKAASLRVPDEVAVIGADNDDLVCELSDPPMTSVGLNFERAGHDSAEILHQLMRGIPAEKNKIVVPATQVVPRQSTGIFFMDDPVAVKALRFIRAHAREPIQVNNVANAAGLSRRVLEKRFRKMLGRTVMEEIRRARVEQISRMLAETNEPVSQIALAMGCQDLQHFARYFRRQTGKTPLDYRHEHGLK